MISARFTYDDGHFSDRYSVIHLHSDARQASGVMAGIFSVMSTLDIQVEMFSRRALSRRTAGTFHIWLDTCQVDLYVSVDMDALDPSFAPGVSHHEPGGLSSRQLLTSTCSTRSRRTSASWPASLGRRCRRVQPDSRRTDWGCRRAGRHRLRRRQDCQGADRPDDAPRRGRRSMRSSPLCVMLENRKSKKIYISPQPGPPQHARRSRQLTGVTDTVSCRRHLSASWHRKHGSTALANSTRFRPRRARRPAPWVGQRRRAVP